MADLIQESLCWIENRLATSTPVQKLGRVVQLTGLIIEAEGPEASIGDLVEIFSRHKERAVAAEVVGFRYNRLLLMPLGETAEVHPGCKVIASPKTKRYPVGNGLVGRVIDGFGKPIDNQGPLRAEMVNDLHSEPVNPMERNRINCLFETRVKAIDNFVTLGKGQRVGIYAGSGVGKSSLMAMIARSSEADVNVIALVGERGRELREFIENDLGTGIKKSVLVISTSDQPAPLRIRAAQLATRIAESFREQGQNVLLLMDSLTRVAMAQREIGLSVGEPPTTRGYTPSVFSLLPKLIERSGNSSKGSITSFYTVLVEGDDMNDPIADSTRALLDGHIVLSRDLATSNHFPAIDVLESISRLYRQVSCENERYVTSQARDLLSLYKKNEDLINIGAYVKGTNPKIDEAINKYPKIMQFLKQLQSENVSRVESMQMLATIIS